MKTLYSAVWEESHPFGVLADEVLPVLLPEDLKEQDSMLVVWGGADITPALYGHPLSRTTHPGGKRDYIEWALMKEALAKGIPIIGICRGAQMLCALAGGYLLQDVRNHSGGHNINTFNGEILYVNSLHHQMMEPSMTDHELLAWSEQNRSEAAGYIWKDDQLWTPPTNWKEPECIYFPKVKGLAVQWHPEMMGIASPATEFVLDMIEDKLCNQHPMTVPL